MFSILQNSANTQSLLSQNQKTIKNLISKVTSNTLIIIKMSNRRVNLFRNIDKGTKTLLISEATLCIQNCKNALEELTTQCATINSASKKRLSEKIKKLNKKRSFIYKFFAYLSSTSHVQISGSCSPYESIVRKKLENPNELISDFTVDALDLGIDFCYVDKERSEWVKNRNKNKNDDKLEKKVSRKWKILALIFFMIAVFLVFWGFEEMMIGYLIKGFGVAGKVVKGFGNAMFIAGVLAFDRALGFVKFLAVVVYPVVFQECLNVVEVCRLSALGMMK